jgi:hypothetical protein
MSPTSYQTAPPRGEGCSVPIGLPRTKAVRDTHRMTRRITLDQVRRIALTLPAVEEGTSYGTPAFKVRGKLFLRLRDENATLVVKVDRDERAALIASAPKIYSVTDHYVNYPWVLVSLADVSIAELEELVTEAWRLTAPSKLRAEFDAG